MKNFEYEYSFNVKSLEPYIEFCKENDYHFVEESSQIRTIYRNNNKTMARITINKVGGIERKELDFKEDNMEGDSIVKERKESKAIEFTDDEAVESILDFLEYKKDNTLKRTRYIFKRDGVKFELDKYFEPSLTCVVAIEGDKQEVDKVYEIVKNI